MSSSVSSLPESYPAVPEAIGRARRAVDEFLPARGGAPEVAERVALAVSEACTNVVVHAYVEAAQQGEFRVTAEVLQQPGERDLRVVVADDGSRDAAAYGQPGARCGLPIIAQSSAVYEVRSSPAGGAELCMRFALNAPRRTGEAPGTPRVGDGAGMKRARRSAEGGGG
jgi:serine/threonine-protein kinase RsbW